MNFLSYINKTTYILKLLGILLLGIEHQLPNETNIRSIIIESLEIVPKAFITTKIVSTTISMPPFACSVL
jgi:hypothetical protein